MLVFNYYKNTQLRQRQRNMLPKLTLDSLKLRVAIDSSTSSVPSLYFLFLLVIIHKFPFPP